MASRECGISIFCCCRRCSFGGGHTSLRWSFLLPSSARLSLVFCQDLYFEFYPLRYGSNFFSRSLWGPLSRTTAVLPKLSLYGTVMELHYSSSLYYCQLPVACQFRTERAQRNGDGPTIKRSNGNCCCWTLSHCRLARSWLLSIPMLLAATCKCAADICIFSR